MNNDGERITDKAKRYYDRFRCELCDFTFGENCFLRAPNPFDEADELLGCPKCRGVRGFVFLYHLREPVNIATRRQRLFL